MKQPSAPDPSLECDVTRKFVRVTQVRSDGLVAFEFSIGWPELAAELVLPRAAFDEFCSTHQVQRLDDETLTQPIHEIQTGARA